MSSGPTSLTWGIMVFNATFNNISVISCRSVLLVEETGLPGDNHRPVASHWQILSHNVVSSTPRQWAGFELTTFVVIYTDCTCSCKSNYHMITTTTAPLTIHAQSRSVFNRAMSIIQWPYITDDFLSVSVCIRVSANQGTPRNMRKYPITGTVHHNPGFILHIISYHLQSITIKNTCVEWLRLYTTQFKLNNNLKKIVP